MARLMILSPDEIKTFDKPPRFTPEQRHKYFQLHEKLWPLLEKLRTPTHKVGLLVQWGYFRASGRFFKLSDSHRADIKYAAQQLEIPYAEVDWVAYQEKRKMYREHQQAILNAMHFRPFDRRAKGWLQGQLENLAAKHTQPRDMIYYLASQCHQQQIEIPSYHYFTEQITFLYNRVESQLLSLVKQHITTEQKKQLTALLDESIEPPLISQWKTHNQSLRVKPIQADINTFAEIKSCFYALQPLLNHLALTSHSAEYYATWVKKAKLSQLKQIPDPAKLYLHLAAFIQHQFYRRQDALIDVFVKSVQAMRGQAKTKRIAYEQSQRSEHLKLMKNVAAEQERLETFMANITQIIHEEALSDSHKVDAIKALLQKHQALQGNIPQQEPLSQKIQHLLNDDTYYNLLETLSIPLQRRVSAIIKTVDFDVDTSERSIIAAINYFKKKDGDIDQDAPIDFLDNKEQNIVFDTHQTLRVSLYKSLLFLHIASGIKAGSLNVKHSYRYKAIQDYLIPTATWAAQKSQLVASAGLSHFAAVDDVLAHLKSTLDTRYRQVNDRLIDNPHLHFNATGHYALNTPRVEKKNMAVISDLLLASGFVPIIQILSDINRNTQFVESFTHYSVKHQKLKPTPETIIAGLMAKGHNIGIRKISDISIGINGNTLRQVVNWFFTLKNIQTANNKIIALINKLALSHVFKYQPEMTHTSSDGQKYQVAVDSLLANYSFKYFGKDKGVTVYTFIDDRQSLFYSTVISASEREAAYVLDGLLHNDVVKSDIHSTDMHGYTESIFAATHFMGTSFAPRFKNLSHNHIYAFSAQKTYANKGYKILPSRTINTVLIREHWDDILRFMVTIKLKETCASQLFKRLSSYAKDHPLYKAIKEFGRIIKSLFLLTYLDEVELRQHIEKQLNRVELSNKFAKAVFFEKNQEFTVATREEQEIVVSCKSLIQNAIVLWNYLYLSQRLVSAKKAHDKAALLSIIKNGSLMTWQHVNMRGEYDFTKAANRASFDMAKILTLKIEDTVP